jgi:hypothetical protein
VVSFFMGFRSQLRREVLDLFRRWLQIEPLNFVLIFICVYPFVLAGLSLFEPPKTFKPRETYRKTSRAYKIPQHPVSFNIASMFHLIEIPLKRFAREEVLLYPNGIVQNRFGISIRAKENAIKQFISVYIEEINPNQLRRQIPANYEPISPFFQFGRVSDISKKMPEYFYFSQPANAPFLIGIPIPKGLKNNLSEIQILYFHLPQIMDARLDWRWENVESYRVCDLMYMPTFLMYPPPNSEETFVLARKIGNLSKL